MHKLPRPPPPHTHTHVPGTCRTSPGSAFEVLPINGNQAVSSAQPLLLQNAICSP